MAVVNIACALGALGITLGAAALRPADKGPAVQVPTLPDTSAIPAEMVNAGRRIFHGQGTCFACHGMNLEGGPIAPTLKPHAWKDALGGELSAIFYVDTHGVRGTVMVAHPGNISDADAVRVAAYIWSVDHDRAKP
jgi:mono/diheme cytochrome c family protein